MQSRLHIISYYPALYNKADTKKWFNLIFIHLIVYFFVETAIGCSEYQEVREPTSHASSLLYISHHPNISSASSIDRTDSVFSHFLYLFLILSLCLYLAPSLSFPPFFFIRFMPISVPTVLQSENHPILSSISFMFSLTFKFRTSQFHLSFIGKTNDSILY